LLNNPLELRTTTMKTLKIEVIGPDPPCVRCQTVRRVAEEAAERLESAGIKVEVEKANILSKEIIGKYGTLVSPAVAIDGVVRIMGRIPNEAEVEELVKAATEERTQD
jgi:hypothetical protein